MSRNRIVTTVDTAGAYVSPVDPSRLAVIPLFSGLADSDLVALAAVASEVQATDGETVVAVWALERRAPAVVDRLRALIAERQPSPAA